MIVYKGKGRTETVKEQEGARGYAVGSQGLISYIGDQLPGNEEIEFALATSTPRCGTSRAR